MENDKLWDTVRVDEEWLEHIKEENTPYSHKMFTDPSYHLSFWQKANHGIVLIDEEGSIITANPYFCDLVDKSISELRHESFYKLIDARYFKKDILNINEVINSAAYSYQSDTQLTKQTKLVPVRILATRVPSTLSHPFRHIIIHIYRLRDVHIVKNPEYEKTKNYIFGWKELLLQPWFIKSAFVFLTILAVLLSLSGHLVPILEKLLLKM